MKDVRFAERDLLKSARMKVILNFSFAPILIMIALLLSACSSSKDLAVNSATVINQTNVSRNMNESNSPNVEVRTSIEELEKQINLPVRPSEVKWTAETFDNEKGAVPGPNDYRLTVTLKYNEKSVAELTKKLEAETPEKSLGKADVKAWFPNEIKTEVKAINGKNHLEGAKYSVNSFKRGSYQNGNLIRVGTSNYFVLNLFSF